ncbi:1411_t:CDS:2, partial [Dentiscutata heterogama]
MEKLENLDKLSDQSELAKDIFKLNQILLTRDKNIKYLDNYRKARFHNGYYDNIEKDKIDKLDDKYLIKDKQLLHNLRKQRINDLQNPVPKRPAPENNQLTTEYPNRNTDNTTLIRNERETAIVQINFIINKYKKTLNANDLKKFGQMQTNK